jgi:hypothetical protein
MHRCLGIAQILARARLQCNSSCGFGDVRNGYGVGSAVSRQAGSPVEGFGVASSPRNVNVYLQFDYIIDTVPHSLTAVHRV